MAQGKRLMESLKTTLDAACRQKLRLEAIKYVLHFLNLALLSLSVIFNLVFVILNLVFIILNLVFIIRNLVFISDIDVHGWRLTDEER